jgi:hypothetical protein
MFKAFNPLTGDMIMKWKSSLIFIATLATVSANATVITSLDFHVLNGGSFDDTTGVYTRGGTDEWQGVVASFAPVTLTNVNDSVRIDFTWLGGSISNNSGQRLAFGFFDGTAVTGNNQIAATDAWTGYFHSIGTRSSAGDSNHAMGFYRQGSGTQNLFERDGSWAGTTTAASVNGMGVLQSSGFRPPINQTATTNLTIIATRTSETQITFTTIYDTLRADGTGSGGSSSTIEWNGIVSSGVATLNSVHNIADGGPVTISGVGLVGSTADFTVTVIPEPGTLVLVGIALGSLLLFRRRR